LSSPQSRDYTPGDYVQGDYVTYPHKYVDGEIVEIDESELTPVTPPLGTGSGGGRKKRVRKEPRQLLVREEVKEKKPKPERLKPTVEPVLKTVSKTFIAIYNIEALPDNLRTILQQQEEIDRLIEQLNRSKLELSPAIPTIVQKERPASPPMKIQERIKVSKTFTAIYHRYALVEKSVTALYQKRQLVSKSFTGLYDIKAPDYEYLNRLKRARAFADLIDVIDPE
jgi:hypothetical protein